ncbi:MAG: RagB/SusD family nutrient uptake outer membrane protein [Bacteroidales bacterium]|nr:RagB/SusD family nutrient uptake outer membrane protein [Bacteroidales bacterium]
MKTINSITYILIIAFTIGWTSCSDFLDTVPDDKITGDNFYQNEDDFRAATAALYNVVWWDFNEKFYYGLGDGRAYNLYAPFSDYIYPFMDLTESGITGPLVQAWQSLYNVVQQSNKVVIGISNSPLEEGVKNQYIAEARMMRGTAYWYLASLWGNVIINENPDELVINPIVNTSPLTDVYEYAMRDLEFAAKYLNETSYQPGRLNKYSAFGMLSRIYLSRAGLSSNPNSGTRDASYLELAKKAAEKVINESDYTLMEKYEDLFMIDNNNNSESMFALQWVSNGEWGTNNPQQAFFASGSQITGDDAAWGYWTRATYDVLLEYEEDDLRRRATWMGQNDFYPEINAANGGYTHDIPNDFLNVKKGVVGSNKDNPLIFKQSSALNTYMLRLAEVYLNYAEAVLGDAVSTNDAIAIELVNRLRTRAGLTNAKTSLTYADLIHERRVELCMEGQYWYDLVRRSYYQQQEVINYIIGQQRGVIVPFIYETSTNTVSVDPEGNESSRAIGIIDASIFLMPYPESEVVQNPLLKQAPVPYAFTEERITDLF